VNAAAAAASWGSIWRFIVGACASVAAFSGCGQAPATDAARPTVAAVKAGGHDALASKALLYLAAMPIAGAVYVYTYPEGHLVGKLTGFYEPFGECIDSAGDVFIVALAGASSTSSTIYEFAHGGSTPIATLSDPGLATGCAVDSVTGDLAASGQSVAIFHHARGTPTTYSSPSFNFYYCGYDTRGNLYLSASNGKNGGAQLVRLPAGGNQFEQISLDATLKTGNLLPSVQWDGRDLVVSSDAYRDPITIFRLRISGHRATIVGSALLDSMKNYYHGQLWIQDKTIIGAGGSKRGNEDAFFWSYPAGGAPERTIKRIGGARDPQVSGVAVSLAESR